MTCWPGAHLLFVGNERSSTLTIYDITAFPGAPPKMIDQFAMANPTGNTNATWDELFASRQVGIVDPESMKWVQINDNEGQLLVAGAVSGTISAYKVGCGS